MIKIPRPQAAHELLDPLPDQEDHEDEQVRVPGRAGVAMITPKFDYETLARLEAEAKAASDALFAVMGDTMSAQITEELTYTRLEHLEQQARITGELLRSAMDAKFAAEWPYSFDLQKSGPWGECENALRVKTKANPDFRGWEIEVMLPEMADWLDEHVGRDGYALRNVFMIGLRAVNHGFHFRCRWM